MLRIPNRTNTEVVYSFMTRAEMANVQSYRQMVKGAEDVEKEENYFCDKRSSGSVGPVINYTIVALPCQIDLICKASYF